jgi:SepF-like predicted cell division protein (DUF552 family)
VGKRDTAILLRMSEEELEQIRERMAVYGTTNMSAFIRKMAIDGYVVKLDLPELKEMTRLLSSYSNNLNQIARRVNATGNVYSSDLEEIRQNQESMWQAADKIIRALAKIK